VPDPPTVSCETVPLTMRQFLCHSSILRGFKTTFKYM
jgi:hypothetical protein